MIVECAGLPGAGKTTICRVVSVPHGGKGAVPLSALRPSPALLRAAWHVSILCIAARPFSLDRLKRGFNLLVFLRHYENREITILLDQGIVQKLWSILVDATTYSGMRLDRLFESLIPFAPDHLVWIETPVALAIKRIAARRHGKSRFDGLSSEAAQMQLATRIELFERLVTTFAAVTRARLLKLDGEAEPKANAARIAALFG